jgi:hypothetical protein
VIALVFVCVAVLAVDCIGFSSLIKGWETGWVEDREWPC